MTQLRDLQDKVASAETSLSEALRLFKVFTSRTKLEGALYWANQEASGYAQSDILPPYRGPFLTQVTGQFGDRTGRVLKNAPIPSVAFPESYRNGNLFQVSFVDSVAGLEALTKDQHALTFPWSGDAVALTNHLIMSAEIQGLYEGMHLLDASQRLGGQIVQGILETVRNRLLDFLLSLEDVEPDAGESALSPESKTQASSSFQTIIYGGTNNIANGSSDFVQRIDAVNEGDKASLLAALSEVGVTPAELHDLGVALDVDQANGDDKPGPGRSVRDWSWRVGLRIAHISGTVSTDASAHVVALMVAKYFGIH